MPQPWEKNYKPPDGAKPWEKKYQDEEGSWPAVRKGIEGGVAGPAYGVAQIGSHLPTALGGGMFKSIVDDPANKKQATGEPGTLTERATRLLTTLGIGAAMPGGGFVKGGEMLTEALEGAIGTENAIKALDALHKVAPILTGSEKGAVSGGIQPTQSGSLESHAGGAVAGGVAGAAKPVFKALPTAGKIASGLGGLGLGALAADQYGGRGSGLLPFAIGRYVGLPALAGAASALPGGAAGALAGQGADMMFGKPRQEGSTP